MHASAVERLHPRVQGGLVLLVADLPAPFGAAFTIRCGGVSAGAFSQLDLSPRVGDDPAAVAENRRRLARALVPDGAPVELISPLQVHGVRVVGAAEYRRAAPDGCDRVDVSTTTVASSQPPGCDGLVVHRDLDRGLAALLLYADCVPVILAGEVDVAVAHAGWRGLLGGVVQEAARRMTAPPGLAYVGPSIGACCYVVSDDVAEQFSRRYGARTVIGDRVGGAPRVDLWAAAEAALEEIEVPAARVVNPRLCTSCNADLFYSHRRSGGVTGRHGAVAWVAG
jgi:YfiH family protein